MENEITVIERQFEMEQKRFDIDQRKAKAYATSMMMPQHLRDIGSMMILNQMSSDLKIPMLLLAQNIFMVKGKVGMSAQLVISLINGSGIYDHDLQFEERVNPFGVRAYAEKDGKRIDGIWIDEEMIVSSGWYNNSNWKSLKPLMARYRSASYFARLNCPMVLMGFSTDDEIIDTSIAEPKVDTGEAKTLNMAVSTKADKKEPESDPETLEIFDVFDPDTGEIIKDDPEVYPSKEEAERDHPLIVDPDLSPLDELKLKADELGVSYRRDIGYETLEKKIKAEEIENAKIDELMEQDVPVGTVLQLNEDEIPV